MEKKSDNLEYGFRAVLTKKFSYNTPVEVVKEGKVYEFNYNVTPIIKYLVQDDLILVTLNVEISLKEPEKEVCDIETDFVFHVKSLKNYLEHVEKNNSWKFKDQRHEALLITLVSISLSTLRGILIEKSHGTILESSPLPIMNPQNFFKKKEK